MHAVDTMELSACHRPNATIRQPINGNIFDQWTVFVLTQLLLHLTIESISQAVSTATKCWQVSRCGLDLLSDVSLYPIIFRPTRRRRTYGIALCECLVHVRDCRSSFGTTLCMQSADMTAFSDCNQWRVCVRRSCWIGRTSCRWSSVGQTLPQRRSMDVCSRSAAITVWIQSTTLKRLTAFIGSV